ncbi:MAG: HEAT repeat domain-containing protein [Firmicutes bacterium]|nr:HEAT repeat domain-containing protein [Bacillota bacterium]
MLFRNDIKKIEKLAEKEKYQKIIPFLQSKDKNTRIAAIKSFKNVDIPDIYNNLISMLNCTDSEERLAVIEALSLTKESSAITHLSHILNEEKDKKVITAIRNAIVNIRTHCEKI